jgi:hypothetical protein
MTSRLGLMLALSALGFYGGDLWAQVQDRGQAHSLSLMGGNDEWTTTGIEVAANDLVAIFATGKVTVGTFTGQVGPEGANGSGYIEGKVGAGNPFVVGNRFTFVADQPGVLKVRVHDRNYADNSGAFVVTVVRIPASLIPPVEAYTPGESGAAEPSALPPNNAVYVAAMKSDLRNLVTAEEVFFADSVRYSARIGPGGVDYSISEGNTWPTITLTRDGWTAVIGNRNTPTRCVMFIGSTPLPPAVREGEPACE